MKGMIMNRDRTKTLPAARRYGRGFLYALLALPLAYLAWQTVGHTQEAAVMVPPPAVDLPLATSSGEATAVLSGGCFWGMQGVFEHVKGVKQVLSGYSGGTVKDPSYEMVSSGNTGHAESVQIKYDPSQVTYGTLLRVFFSVAHNPTELNYQGPDQGTQYRSAIFYSSDEQKKVAAAYIAQLEGAKVFSDKIVTEQTPYSAFYPAEGYHQDFLINHPDQGYIVFNDLPKIANLKKLFPDLYRDTPVTVSSN
jgi:peptide-methionine (S)-S-oxide reductase